MSRDFNCSSRERRMEDTYIVRQNGKKGGGERERQRKRENEQEKVNIVQEKALYNANV